MKIVCLGDSLTFGFGVPRTQCFTSILENIYDITVVNRGINGDTTGGMLSRFQQDVLKEKPNMVFLMGGANDIFTSETCIHAKSNFASMIQQSLASGIKPVVCLGVPYVVEQIPAIWKSIIDFSISIPETASYYNWLRSYAQVFSIPLIDFFTYFLSIEETQRSSYYLDGLHMNHQGHLKMVQCIKTSGLLTHYEK